MPGGVQVSGGKVTTPAGAAPILPLLVLGAGGYLMWFGVKYWRSQTQVWPSDPVKSVLQGKGLPATTAATAADVQLTAYESQVSSGIAAAEGGQPAPSGTSGTGGGTGGVNTSGTVKGWIGSAMARAGVSGADWASGLAIIITHESGGNPFAINRTDINAQQGHPSQGLMQLIPGNFTTYHVPGTSNNIMDPVANVAAGIKYIQARYGGIDNVPGVRAVRAGQPYVPY